MEVSGTVSYKGCAVIHTVTDNLLVSCLLYTSCSDIWNCLEKCSNCISRLSMQTRKRMTKLEVAGDDPYQVVSMYVEIDGKPCCLEMASRIDGDFMPDGYSREEILSSVRIHKEKIYIDPVTGVYNKRYYVEKLSKMDNVAALMFADIKNFKKIKDVYKRQPLCR